MPNMYVAYNAAHSATTALGAGTSYATGAKLAIQLKIPSGGQVQLVGWGISFDEDVTANAAANAALVEIASTATASTCSTAHTTSTVLPWLDPNAATSRLTISATTDTGYGNGAITSNTTLRYADRRYVPQTSSVDILIPSDRQPIFGATGAIQYLQFRINTTGTVNALCYMIWSEII